MKKQQELTTVTYNFKDNTKVVQTINKELLVDNYGRKRTISELHNVFQTTAWDKGAISYTLDSDSYEEISKDKEIHFTSKERYIAKKDYKEFKRQNPEGFKKEKAKFTRELTDMLAKRRLKFNLTALNVLN